ncbi:hypothetical protein ADL21_02770 [Streptomyces albus subsp. albus]|nr:hypothetical protein ADL21_02770 [Streptomyces albus subsp. albus]
MGTRPRSRAAPRPRSRRTPANRARRRSAAERTTTRARTATTSAWSGNGPRLLPKEATEPAPEPLEQILARRDRAVLADLLPQVPTALATQADGQRAAARLDGVHQAAVLRARAAEKSAEPAVVDDDATDAAPAPAAEPDDAAPLAAPESARPEAEEEGGQPRGRCPAGRRHR